MKKFFKNPDEAKQSNAPSVSKILDKVFSKGIEGSKFFYKAAFDYKIGEKAPFLYIGSFGGPWKKYIQSSKKDPDFVAGVCKLQKEGNETTLLMEAQMGKGSKALFLKDVNKELLKKLGIKAEFVETLGITVTDEEEEEEGEEDAEVVTPKVGTTNITPEQMAAEFKNVTATFKNIRVEHNSDQIDELLDQIADWEDNYKNASPKEQQALAAALTNIQKVSASLQQINQIDSKVDVLMEKIYPLIEEYIELDDHSSEKALELKSNIEKNILKIEALAQKISDNDFMEACKEFRAVLAS